MHMYLLNEKPKIPFKSLKSEMAIEEFNEFILDFIDAGNSCNIWWAVNYDSPEWSPTKEQPFLQFLESVDPDGYRDQLNRFTNIDYAFGTLLIIPNLETNIVEIHIIWGLEEFWEIEVCIDCFSTMFMDEFEGPISSQEAVDKLVRTYPIIQHDQSRDDSFSTLPCDCCNSHLGGNRYMLICMKDNQE